MRFGICADLAQLEVVQEMGFNYLEAALAPLAQLPEEEFSASLEKARQADIRPESFNLLFPGSIALVGKQADRRQITDYLRTAFRRMRLLGGEVVVFGSSRSRSYPAELGFAEGYRQLRDITRLIGEIAEEQGVLVAIEPLNSSETNLINSLTEGAILEADAECPSIRLLADSYHMFYESEPMEHIERVGALLHTHVALLEGRGYPIQANGPLRDFFAALRGIGYEGRMSIEGHTERFEQDAPAALRTLRELDKQCYKGD